MWESGSLTTGAGTTTMQSVCNPIARCWDSMYKITSKANSGLGVQVTPHLVHPYFSPTATRCRTDAIAPTWLMLISQRFLSLAGRQQMYVHVASI